MESGEVKGSILVVDDDANVRTSVAALLRHLGYTVHPRASYAEAVNILEEDNPISLILSDILMPEKNGEDLFEYARENHPALPIIFMSGSVPFAIEQRLELTPGVNFVRKPFTLHQLRELIERHLPRNPRT